ncbi:hypothetical protein P9265_15455 [Schinkia azotoformans]|uniref:hypothetical protein n=1 Tax=Schinkia azotoformans TaxID=1454 RepID=UPI002E1DB0C5|nr:hypothetical protein [Schinkia azotoformans]
MERNDFRISRAYRLKPESVVTLERLAHRLGCTKTEVLERGINLYKYYSDIADEEIGPIRKFSLI